MHSSPHHVIRLPLFIPIFCDDLRSLPSLSFQKNFFYPHRTRESISLTRDAVWESLWAFPIDDSNNTGPQFPRMLTP
jgi:hypothetical protein